MPRVRARSRARARRASTQDLTRETVADGNATREELWAKVLLGFSETLGQLGKEAQAAFYTTPALSVQVRRLASILHSVYIGHRL